MKKPILALIVVLAALGVSLLIAMVNNQDTTQITPEQNQSMTSNQTTQNSTNNQSSGITLAELSLHNSRTDCWLLYKGKVYDITSWLPKHPGSVGAISPYCGNKGFEAAFIAQHGTTKASLFLKIAQLMGDFNEMGTLN